MSEASTFETICEGKGYSIEVDGDGLFYMSSEGAEQRVLVTPQTHRGWSGPDIDELHSRLLEDGMDEIHVRGYFRQAGW